MEKEPGQPEIYNEIPEDAPEVMERFSKELLVKEDQEIPENVFEQLLEKHNLEFQRALEELLSLWETKEHRKTLGHDQVHISYDLLEFLYLSEQGGLKNSEKYMVLFGSLLHDLGRYPELLLKERSGAMDFKKGKQIQFHAALSGYLGSMFAKKHKAKEDDSQIIEASKAFNRRVIGATLFHGGKNEERDPVAHHVQSIDRLAGILGSREFVRNVVTDGAQRGAAVYPDERLSYDEAFPLFNNLPVEEFSEASEPQNSWTNIVHYLEMPLRNMFPLSTEYGMERSKAMKRESGIILTFLAGGKDTSLYAQIFAPELNPIGEYKFPKNRIPQDIWQEIEKGINEEETAEMKKYEGKKFQELVKIMLFQQAPDAASAEIGKVCQLFEEVPDHHQEDARRAVQYVVARRSLNKKIERQLLQEKKQSSDPLVRNIATHLLKNE